MSKAWFTPLLFAALVALIVPFAPAAQAQGQIEQVLYFGGRVVGYVEEVSGRWHGEAP